MPSARVRLVSGRGTRDKIVELSGDDADELDGRVASAEEEESPR